MEIKIDVLKERIRSKGFTLSTFSKAIGMNQSTMYRKMKLGGRNFTVGEIEAMVNVLELNNGDASFIFCFSTRNNAS